VGVTRRAPGARSDAGMTRSSPVALVLLGLLAHSAAGACSDDHGATRGAGLRPRKPESARPRTRSAARVLTPPSRGGAWTLPSQGGALSCCSDSSESQTTQTRHPNKELRLFRVTSQTLPSHRGAPTLSLSLCLSPPPLSPHSLCFSLLLSPLSSLRVPLFSLSPLSLLSLPLSLRLSLPFPLTIY
jgi:hypothetical protein